MSPADGSPHRSKGVSAVNSTPLSTCLVPPLGRVTRSASIAASGAALNEDFRPCRNSRKMAICREKPASTRTLHSCGNTARPRGRQPWFPRLFAPQTCGQPGSAAVRLYCRPPGSKRAPAPLFSDDHEADLSAECTQTEAQAWLPRADVHAGRSPDPQAPPGQGSEAPLGVSRCSAGIASPVPATSTMSTAAGGLCPRVSDAVLVRPRGAGRRSAPGARCAPRGRQCRRAQQDQAPAARVVPRAAIERVAATHDYVLASGRVCPRRPRRTGMLGLWSGSTRFSGRPALRSRRRSLPIRAYQLVVSPWLPAEHVQIPPELLGVRGSRDPEARCDQGPLPGRPPARPLSPLVRRGS